MRFEFATAGRIIFGVGTLHEAGAIAASLGSRALVVFSAPPERAQPLLSRLADSEVTYTLFQVDDEPSISLVETGVDHLRQFEANVVIGIGGGSVIDTAKAVAALATNPGSALDYLEVIGQGRSLVEPPLPCLAIPTTAGTGAEVTRNAVLASPEHKVKVSLRHPLMLPRVALVDPELTYSMPPSVTASTGMDALTQVLEPYVSPRSNPLTDGLCREGLQRAARALRRAYTDGTDSAAREDMALTSLLGGLALANAGLGAVHGFAGPFGGMFHAPHGAICARLLPYVTRVNVRALQARDPHAIALKRYDEVGQILTGRQDATAADAVHWIEELSAELNIPPLGHYGFTRADFPSVIEKSARASSMKGNPLVLTPDEMEEILEQAL